MACTRPRRRSSGWPSGRTASGPPRCGMDLAKIANSAAKASSLRMMPSRRRYPRNGEARMLADPTPGFGPGGVVDGHVTPRQDTGAKPLEILGPRVPLSRRVRVVRDEDSDASDEVERRESSEDAAVADGPGQKDRVRDDEHQEKLAPDPLAAEPPGEGAGEPDERNEVEDRPGQAEKAGQDSQACDAPRREHPRPRSRAEQEVRQQKRREQVLGRKQVRHEDGSGQEGEDRRRPESRAVSPEPARELRSGESREDEERKIDQLRAGQRRALGRSAKRE